MPRLLLLAGPNGAGKTTLARRLFPAEIAAGWFLNADEVARSLRPDDVEGAMLAAGREVLLRRHQMIAAKQDFLAETTLSSRALLRDLAKARAQGFHIEMHFLFAPNPEICVQRVAFRAQAGGHAVANDVITRRYWRGLSLLSDAIAVAHHVLIWDVESDPRLIAEVHESSTAVLDPATWGILRERMQGR